MKIALIFLLLSGVVLGQNTLKIGIPDSAVAYVGRTSEFVIGGSLLYSNTINIFGTSFFIKDGRLEITYDKDIKPSESVKQFFEWVKEYVKGEYYLIKRKDLDKLINREK